MIALGLELLRVKILSQEHKTHSQVKISPLECCMAKSAAQIFTQLTANHNYLVSESEMLEHGSNSMCPQLE